MFLADARILAGNVKGARTLMKDAQKRIAWLADYDSDGEYGRRAAALSPTIDSVPRKLADQPYTTAARSRRKSSVGPPWPT